MQVSYEKFMYSLPSDFQVNINANYSGTCMLM